MSERGLSRLAKLYRKRAGKTRTQASRDMGVSHVSIYRAEEKPRESLASLRIRMINTYSRYRVSGPWFRLKSK